MSQLITNRVRLSRRSLLKGLTAAGARIVVGLPPLVSMFNSHGHRLCGRAGDRRREADREPLRALVQRQRHPGAVLDSVRRGRRLSHDAVPLAAGAVPQRRSRAERRGQCGRGRNGQRPHQLHERPDDRHALHRTRPERTVHRPGDRGEDRRRFALPLAADRRLAGIVRREHAAQHELGRIRARAAAGDDSAPPVRPPVRRSAKKAG